MILKVIVKANSKENKIEKINNGEYKVEVREKAEKNKANLAVIKILSKYFGKQVHIKSGLKSKVKIVDVK